MGIYVDRVEERKYAQSFCGEFMLRRSRKRWNNISNEPRGTVSWLIL
jgi:hypothetical protein